MSASTGVAPARRMALTEAKKLKGVVTTAVPGPIPAAASASHRASVPEEQPMAWATPSWRGGGLLKGGYRLAQDKLLRLKYMPERLQQLLVERLVLALEVQHGHGLGGLAAGLRGGVRSVLHTAMSTQPTEQALRISRTERSKYGPGDAEFAASSGVEKAGKPLYC